MGLYETLITLLIITLFMGFVYFTNGETLTEKVLAIDFMSLVGAGVMIVYAVSFDDPVYIDVAIVWSLVSFLGSIAFIIYVNRENNNKPEKEGP